MYILYDKPSIYSTFKYIDFNAETMVDAWSHLVSSGLVWSGLVSSLPLRFSSLFFSQSFHLVFFICPY